MLNMVDNAAPLKPTDTTHRQMTWFGERVEKGRKAPFVEIVAVTPEIAKRLLEMNDGNRPISERLVEEIAADIEGDRWTLNGETIIVSRDGLLNDGQHRLEAVVRTQKPIQSAIMFGVSREGRMTVDMGRQRTAGNFLAMDGVVHSNHSATVGRLLLLHKKGVVRLAGLSGYYAPTKQEIRVFYKQNRKAIIGALSEVVNQRFARTANAITPIAAAHVLLTRLNATEAAVFFARLNDGTNLKAGDSILDLRARLVSIKKDRLTPGDKLELILRYWNKWRSKSKAAVHRKGSYPEIVR